MEIFCPNNHLILDAQTCKKCGWQRPIGGQVGKAFWGPVDVLAGLGGESREKFANLCNIDNTLLLSLRSNELVGVSLLNGMVKWRVAIPVGKRVVSLQNEDEQIYVVMQDTHSLMEGVEPGAIQRLDPEDGRLTPFWQAPSHDMTPPAFWQDWMLVRTAESTLYALHRSDPEQILWQYPLQTWWPAPLAVLDDKVILVDGRAMYGEGVLLAIHAETGQLAWSQALQGMPTKAPTGLADNLVLINGRKELMAVDVSSGEISWRKDYSHIYSAPCATKNQVLIAVRGNKDANAEDHYLLAALSPASGDLIWQVGLPKRVRITPVCVDHFILLADDGGDISALSAQDGQELWRYSFGKEDDPIKTDPSVVGDLAVVGTYFGKLVAISIRQPLESLETPQYYLDQAQWKLAADAFALSSEYYQAAQLYEKRVNEVERALQLYEKGHFFKEAANLALNNELYSRALENYRKSGDTEGEAETLLQMGDAEGAARLLHDLGDALRAASLMEKAGKFKQAAEFYIEAGKTGDYLRLVRKTMWDASEVERIRSSGNYEVAAQWGMDNQKYLEAAKDFRAAGKELDELEALRQHLYQNKDQAEQWVYQRVAELGEGLGDWLSAATAWLHLDRPEDAGNAYYRLAESLAGKFNQELDQIPTREKTQIAMRYQQAADAFRDAGMSENEEICRHQVRRYQQLPQVVILQVESQSGFREMEWNIFTLTAQNIGYGRAIDVTFNIGASRFEVQEESRTFSFSLSCGVIKNQILNLRPLEKQFGDVPLEIKWSWKDKRGNYYQESESIPVKVVAQRDTESHTPIIYHFDKVENLVQGTQIKGDNVAQKGDRVEIHRVSGTQATSKISVDSSEGDHIGIRADRMPASQEINTSIICPNCGKPNSPQAKSCIICRTRLRKDGCADEDSEPDA
jgi:outer membrane protein assembly factor BamB